MTEFWLSVVTAVKDDPAGLSKTMGSLHSQDLDGVQVIVIDGSETPSDLADQYSDVAIFYWEPPSGIYRAMNDGLHRADGTFVCFLNAGDTLHSSDVLARVRTMLDSSVTWAFGPVAIIGEDGNRTATPHWDYPKEKGQLFARGYFPQHQGVFARRDTLVGLGGFSPGYAIAADYRMNLLLSQIADPTLLDFTIADFSVGGASTVHWRRSFREFHRARREVFQPRGGAAVRERWNTAWHFVRVWVYRKLVAPLRRTARR